MTSPHAQHHSESLASIFPRHSPIVVEVPERPTRPAVFNLDLPIVITIDGPAGTGKSTVARELARRLGLDFLDTGAMYRAAASVALDRGIALDEVDELIRAIREADIRFDWSADPPLILAHDRPVNKRIREQDVTAVVSAYSGVPQVRDIMVQQQRQIAKQHPRLVTEGRDQGSVVFPDARVKFYLDASPRVRAARRGEELRRRGVDVDLTALQAEIERRDKSDRSRVVGPLVMPEHAEVVDTSELTIEEVVSRLQQSVLRLSRE